MIDVRQISKTFQDRKRGIIRAVDQVSFTVNPGEVYALLGANGAGKTTALRILSTLMTPTSGDAFINDLSVTSQREAVRRLIGVVSYETGVYEKMTPREIGTYFGRLNDISEESIAENLEEIFALLEMSDFADQRTDRFSSGMKQKTVIMRALVTQPQVLIFDEPTSGLDLMTAKRVTDYIRLFKQAGKTVVFSTHILWEAERLADQIGIIHQGRLVKTGSLEQLQAETGHKDIEEIFFSVVQAQGAVP